MLFKKVLVANRGEIAVRVIRACHDLGILTVAIYSDADRASLHVQMADEAFCVGPAPSRESYLNVPAIMSTAELLNVDAIHPGYGFLAENAHFAEICRDCKITFIGPSPEAIAKMGNKSQAKEIMRRAGVPVVPGSFGPIRDEAAALATARAIGYPLIIKAAAGGGGRGMRVVHRADDVARALAAAHAEAEAAFGDGALYVEKYLEEPRHVEMQILADGRGTIVSLGERDCSVQRRHQKLIEEAPSPGVTPRLRRALSRAAVRAAEVVGYANAGTVEFLVDQGEHFYFMEMNTRVQVEHPVTEAVTDVDIVKEQIRIAAGERMTIPREIEPRGHAIECRINAEDPGRDFLPSPGPITAFIQPGGPGIRVDTHAFAGYTIPPHYDSLVAKVIAWGRDRDESIARMTRALREFEVGGIRTTIPFHLAVLDNAFFRRGEVYVNFVQRRMDLSAIRA
ncbi:MAG TPA: acetyl-CoA carboxylase biotin carboxylase subunit [bacterium]|nr:acetyl-CoA carboxylase biotin carboxylase subunit [bacterium]